MKKFIRALAVFILFSSLGFVLFHLGECYPEHGTDMTTFCSESKLVYYLWSHMGLVISFILGVGMLCIIFQGYGFVQLAQEWRAGWAHLASLAFPLFYIITLIVAHIGPTDIFYMSRAAIILLLLVILLGQILNLSLFLLKLKGTK